jgi:hypothetical protein
MEIEKREQQMLSAGSAEFLTMRPKLSAGFNNKQRTYTRFILFGEREKFACQSAPT